MSSRLSHHILGTAANLLGFCLIVLTSLHMGNQTQNSLLDEFTSLIAMLLVLSCLFSFISIRSASPQRSKWFETIADYLFIISLCGIFLVVLFLLYKFWNR